MDGDLAVAGGDARARRQPRDGRRRRLFRQLDAVDRRRCAAVARLTLAKVESWQVDSRDAQHPTATVSYTYHVEPAPWMDNDDARRILPMVAKVIKGADGGLQMHQGFTRVQQGWVAVAGPV